jgi:mono/diheme cytochrome c family protein
VTSKPLFALLALVAAFLQQPTSRADATLRPFLETHCIECHDGEDKKGGLDLASLREIHADPKTSAQWIKVFDRVLAGEMPPPKKKAAPQADSKSSFLNTLKTQLIAEETQRAAVTDGRTRIRRLTRVEYENTMRDLFAMPGLALKEDLPADGSAHGFDTNADALDLSHVNLAKYLEAADKVLDLAIATRPNPPTLQKRRISLMNRGGFVAHVVMNGDGVLLRDMKPDPAFPAAGTFNHIDQGAHESIGSFETGSSVGLFRHEDESLSPYFMEHVTIYPGMYRVRTSLWAFQWDKGKVLPARDTEAARLSVVQLTGDGRGGGHPSYTLGYFDAPSLKPTEHELLTWLNHNELIGFNTASLAPVANYSRKGRAMEFTGPGIAVDWLEIEGPLHDVWPPASHRALFGELPLTELKKGDSVKPPVRRKIRQLGAGMNRPDPEPGTWTVSSAQPETDAHRLLSDFLTKAFRRPVSSADVQRYADTALARLHAGDCFETAMRWAYRAALCSPNFLYRVEPEQTLGDHAIANRLAALLWRSSPDHALREAADAGTLRETKSRHAHVERMLADPRSERFITDFLGQWLRLKEIAATDPDKKLYPEFSGYLQDSMVAETKAYFRELIDKNLSPRHLIASDFAMLNGKLAALYGIKDVSGPKIRRVQLPIESARGGFLTQASLLKITANGTTTSPVPRGNFVTDRLLGKPVDPPPPNVPAVEPDVSGTNTIRELLDKHRSDSNCAGCHAKLDPPGFALEAFDVIGGLRSRYRSLGEGDAAPRGNIDPFIPIRFTLGKPVDASGQLTDGKPFANVDELRTHLLTDEASLTKNLVRRLLVFATGRPLSFSDRDAIERIVADADRNSGGVRSILHAVVQSQLFITR